jgi:hypothetical protein
VHQNLQPTSPAQDSADPEDKRLSHVQQWWQETKDYNIIDKNIDSVAADIVNGIGKVLHGIGTVSDAAVNQMVSSKKPEALRDADMLPRTQRQVRQIRDKLREAYDRALQGRLSAIVPLAMATYHAHSEVPFALGADALQVIGGGRKLPTEAKDDLAQAA